MELLDIVDENNNLIGKAEERNIVHEKGLWHRHVGAWIMNEKGEILFQKSACCKPENRSKWFKTGGHVDAGEKPLEAVQREAKEEIGVVIPAENWELISIEKSEKQDNSNHHFTYSFFTKVNYNIEDYSMQKEEVADLKYMTLEEMQEKRDNQDENYTFIYWNDFNEILEILKEKRKELLKNRI